MPSLKTCLLAKKLLSTTCALHQQRRSPSHPLTLCPLPLYWQNCAYSNDAPTGTFNVTSLKMVSQPQIIIPFVMPKSGLICVFFTPVPLGPNQNTSQVQYK